MVVIILHSCRSTTLQGSDWVEEALSDTHCIFDEHIGLLVLGILVLAVSDMASTGQLVGDHLLVHSNVGAQSKRRRRSGRACRVRGTAHLDNVKARAGRGKL